MLAKSQQQRLYNGTEEWCSNAIIADTGKVFILLRNVYVWRS